MKTSPTRAIIVCASVTFSALACVPAAGKGGSPPAPLSSGAAVAGPRLKVAVQGFDIKMGSAHETEKIVR